MFGSLAGEFLDDQIELRKFLAGKTVTENRREVAVLFGKQGQVAFGAADISSKDHPLPLVLIPSFKSVQGILQLWLLLYGLYHRWPSRSSRRSDSRGPQLPDGY